MIEKASDINEIIPKYFLAFALDIKHPPIRIKINEINSINHLKADKNWNTIATIIAMTPTAFNIFFTSIL